MFNTKRGQIIIFVIIGVLILATIGILMFVLQPVYTETPANDMDETVQSIREQVEDCYDQLSNEAVYDIPLQGGYYQMPMYFEMKGFTIVPYYGGRTPTKFDIEQSIAKYITDRIPECVNHFAHYEETGLVVSAEIPVTKVAIYPRYVILEFEYPILVKQGKQSNELKVFPTINVPVRLGLLHSLALEITHMFENDPTKLQITDIDNLFKKYAVNGSYEWDENSQALAFVIHDPKSSFKGRYLYVFGAKF